MHKYSYTARDQQGKIIKGLMSALNEIDLANKIANQGYFLTGSKITQDKQLKGRIGGLKPKDLTTFTMHLATLVEAGIPLVAGLSDLSKNAPGPNMQKLIDDLRIRVENGASLKEALSFYPRTFNNLYLALVGAGEATGKLAFALNSIAAYLEWQMDLRAKIREATTYPVILVVVMVGVVALLVIKVIPLFKPMFQQAKIEIPAATQFLLDLSDFSIKFWWVAILLGIGGVVGLKCAEKTKKGKLMIDSAKLKMPLFGELMKKIVLSRFCHILSLSIQAGVNVLTALDISIQSMGNARLEGATKQARDSINLGEKIASSLDATGEFPPLVLRMVSVGEETGTLAQSLGKVSNFYDKEIPRTINRIFTIFEPMMIVLLGIIVAGIAFSVFLPMIKLAQNLGGG